MIKKQRLAFILTALLTTFISSCSDFNKVAKSTDMEYKKEKAIQYYEAGEYKYSTPLLEELMPLYKHNVEGEKMYFYFAKGNYLLESYILAEYYLKRFIKTYPKSLYTEEAMFLAAMCSVKSSPDVVLDQTPTEQAIIDLQDKIQREGTLSGREFNTRQRQDQKRALVACPEVLSLDASRNPNLQRELANSATDTN